MHMRFGHGLAVVTLGASLLLVGAPTAFAHATYEGSNPPEEGTVSSPPSEVSAEFSEPLIPDNSFMDVTDPCGEDVGGTTAVTAKNMTVQMSGSRAGRYVVSWQAHSSVDGHVTTGSFSFTSTGGGECPGADDRDESSGSRGNGAGSDSDTDSLDSGGTNASGGGAGNSGGNADESDPGTRTDRTRGDGKRSKHDAHRGAQESARSENARGISVAPVAQTDVADVPSALEGIPMDGLVITLAVAALIGAAAGKIYVSLSADD